MNGFMRIVSKAHGGNNYKINAQKSFNPVHAIGFVMKP